MNFHMRRSIKLTDGKFPQAGGPRVTSKSEVGLKSQLAIERTFDFTVSVRSTEGAFEQDLEVELGVECGRSRVERRTCNGRVDQVLCCDRVRSEEPDSIGRANSCVVETCEDGGYIVRWQGEKVGRGCCSGGGTANECLYIRDKKVRG